MAERRVRAAACATGLAAALLVSQVGVAAAWVPAPGATAARGAHEVVDGQLPEPTTDPDEVRSSADDILARPELRPDEPSLVERAVDRVGTELGKLLERGVGSGSGLIGWVLLAALVALVAWLVRRISPSARRHVAAPPVPDVAIEERRSASAWADAARGHEAAGEWVEALRCRYRALVGELVDRDVVRDVPGRTVGEYREDLAAARPMAAAPFRAATSLYEDAWYGHRGAGPAEADEFAHGARAVLEAVER